MQLEKEIIRAVKHISAGDTEETKSQSEMEQISQQVLSDIRNKNFDFTKAEHLIIQQNGKKRFVKRFRDSYCSENVLCQCIKQILDKDFGVKYPNRNKIIRSLFSIMSALPQMADFTIIRFDFKDYFNSISTEYFFHRYIVDNISNREALEIINKYCEEIRFAYAGLSTSNSIAEIIATSFDDLVVQSFSQEGLIYYERYIDDGLLIVNRHIRQNDVQDLLNNALNNVYYAKNIQSRKKCKTQFNQRKFKYISKRSLSAPFSSFDFLGYEFFVSQKNNGVKIQVGITSEKQKKYRDRLKRLISLYTDSSSPDYLNEELLRHRVAAFTSREVYLSTYYRHSVWKVKGFISNYGELRNLLDTGLIQNNTENFLKNMVEDSFRSAGIMPYFLKGAPNSRPGYCLFENMKKNKTLLLVDGIGFDYDSLIKLCGQVGISAFDANGIKRRYESLVRDYLIKVNVGY